MTTITDLPTAATVNADDTIPIAQGGVTKQVRTDVFAAGFLASASASAIAASTSATASAASATASATSSTAAAASQTAATSSAASASSSATAAATSAANAQSSAFTLATWTALSAITGSAAGQGAEVLDADTGTHTDPVVGGTVANAGRFTWSASPAGWKWIGATGLSAKASTSYVKALAENDGYLDPAILQRFTDSTGQIFGTVAADATWDILLSALRSGDLTASEYVMLGATATVYVTDSANNITGFIPLAANDASTEVVAARGSRSSLDTRISQALSAYGTPLTPRFGQETMRAEHYLLTKLAYGEAAQCNIAFIGDSYTHNATRYTGIVADLLTAKYGDAGGGWTGYGFATAGTTPYAAGGNQPSSINGNVRPSKYGLTYVGLWTCTYNASDSPDLSHVVSTTAGDRITRTVPASPTHTALRVVFIGTSNGVVRWRVNAGSWTTQNVQGTVGAVQFFDIALTAGASTTDIETVSGTVWLCGDDALSSASGACIHKLGGTGSQISQWAARTAAQQQAGWAILAPDAFWIMDGTNSQTSGVSASAWNTSLTTMITRFRAAVPFPDICVMMPPENQRGLTPTIATYAAQGREVAALLGTAFIDLQRDFGLVASDYASTSGRPLFNVDGIHPEPATGGRVIAAAVLDTIVAY